MSTIVACGITCQLTCKKSSFQDPVEVLYTYLPFCICTSMYPDILGLSWYILGKFFNLRYERVCSSSHMNIIVRAQDEKCYSTRMLESAVFQYKHVHTTGHYSEEFGFSISS